MIRIRCTTLAATIAAATLVAGASPVFAQDQAKPKPATSATPAKPATTAKPATPAKPAPATAAKPAAAGTKPAAATGAKPAAGATAAKPAPGPGGGQPMEQAKFGSWGVYTSETAKSKVCYALAQPTERLPKTLKRDAGYLFISSRPAEGVRNEVSVVLGFPAKDGTDGSAVIGATTFALVTKGAAAWVKNAAEDAAFVDALRKGQTLVVKAVSKKGNESTDRYTLAGAAQALDRVRKDCP